ncbi:ABC transporter ATP-binding protein [Paenibacillus sp. GM2]|uniref:ABC transporter ATP-binding protein n=1 Tax=Paenibacillus sp. GM2 TaxID=1622070 RepID=UPI0008393D60|nr:ABC transporter ATP-binding protein [Paenibacillus sp. GM2]
MIPYNARIIPIDEKSSRVTASGRISSISLNLTNIGEEVWYAYSKDHPVLIGYHYKSDKGDIVEGMRTKLPYNIAPGESVLVKCNYIVYTNSNKLDIQWDLVREGDSWFNSYGSSSIFVDVILEKQSVDYEEDINDDKAIVCKGLSKKFKLYSKSSSKIVEFITGGFVKRHQNFWALKNISFDVNKGETYGIIGFNGSGKSTLLSILAQTKQHSQGIFQVNGRIAALLELGAGFHPELTGRQNVIYNSYLYSIPSHEIQKQMEAIKDFADIGEFFDKPVKSYSSGMYVRLAFSLAIHVDPDVLIIDEALAVGDEVFQRKCYAKFEEFKAFGKTIILVTHDLNAVRALCDRVGIIYDGSLIFEGNSNDVVNYYQKMSLTANLQVSSQLEKEKDEIRYGNGKAKITGYELCDQEGNASTVFKSGEKLKIRLKSEVFEEISSPVFGVIIKTINGIELFGTNTKILGKQIGTVRNGTLLETEIDLPIYLNEGTYFLTFGITDQSGNETVTIDRMIDVTFIRVLSDIKSIGLVNMNIKAGAKIDVK